MEVYDNNNQSVQKSPLTVGAWVITLLILAVPLLNIIMLFVWAFGGNKDERENFAKAALIWMLIGIILSIAFVSCVGCATITAFSSGMNI